MYVWRLPLFSFAGLVVTLAVSIIVGGLLLLRTRAASPVLRGLLTGGAVVTLLVAPWIVHLLTRHDLALAAKDGLYVHPPAWLFWVPTLGACLLLFLSWRSFPAGNNATRALGYRCAFVLLTSSFAALNLVNWCGPGWCTRFGFPVTYSWWSHQIIIMDGENRSAGFSAWALALDAIVAIAVWYLLAAQHKRGLATASSAKRHPG